jgi:hypothetical protein
MGLLLNFITVCLAASFYQPLLGWQVLFSYVANACLVLF